MAPFELTVKVSATDTFKVTIEDEEDVECLTVCIMSERPELGEELRLLHKGKFLKDNQIIKEIGFADADFVAVVAKKKPAAPGAAAPSATPAAAPDPSDPVAVMLAAAQAGGYAAPAAAAAPAPAGNVVPSGQVGSAPDEAVLTQLCSMGFERPQAIQALQAAFGNPDRAVEYLFNGIPATEPAAEPAAPQQSSGPGSVHTMLGAQLLTKTGLKPTAEALQGVDVVMLYFSAHWCPPCRGFTPQLAAAFNHGSPPSNLACVFVSGDKSEPEFEQYFREMPWMAMPYSNPQRQSLGGTFGVRGIPSIVVLNAKTGATITTSGTQEIGQKGFDLRACMQGWGITPGAAAAAPATEETIQDRLMKASKKEEKEEDPGPPPTPIDDAAANAALERIAAEPWEVQDAFFKTGIKVLNNILTNPKEVKFRTLKRTNAALKSKLLDVAENAGTELVVLAGFEASSEEALTMSSDPDGRCSEVRNRLKKANVIAWEKQARKARDEKIQEEMEKDKANAPRTYGGDGASGRATYGGDRRRGGGGG